MKITITTLVAIFFLVGGILGLNVWSEKMDVERNMEIVSTATSVQIERLQQVIAVDEKIMYRYQQSVDACRTAVSYMNDGNYTGAMIHANDVGETEQDVQPLLNERQQLLQVVNASLL